VIKFVNIYLRPKSDTFLYG